MDVIYCLVFFFLWCLSWSARLGSAGLGPRAIHWPSKFNPTDPPFSQSPVLTDPLFSLRAMAPKRALEPPSAAVGRSDAKASRRPKARPVGSSRTRSKVTFLGPLRTLSSDQSS